MSQKTSLYDLFAFGDPLGSGAFATVFLVTEKSTSKKYAMKVIDKKKCRGKESLIVKEVTLSKTMSHPHIVRMFNCFESKDKVYLQMEFCEGGELFDRIVQEGHYTEARAQRVVANLLSAVKYLHDQHIVHRDIKPENLLLDSKQTLENVKLTDFGFATQVDPDKPSQKTNCGTLMYMAPEILKNERHGKAADMWSIGVITYILLSGYPPFWNEDEAKTMDLIIRGKYEFFSPGFDVISKEAKDFIRHLITVDQTQRFTADQALNHRWILMEDVPEVDIKDKVAPNLMKHFDARKKFKHVIGMVRMVVSLSKHASSTHSANNSRRSSLSSNPDVSDLHGFLNGLKTVNPRRVTLTNINEPAAHSSGNNLIRPTIDESDYTE